MNCLTEFFIQYFKSDKPTILRSLIIYNTLISVTADGFVALDGIRNSNVDFIKFETCLTADLKNVGIP